MLWRRRRRNDGWRRETWSRPASPRTFERALSSIDDMILPRREAHQARRHQNQQLTVRRLRVLVLIEQAKARDVGDSGVAHDGIR